MATSAVPHTSATSNHRDSRHSRDQTRLPSPPGTSGTGAAATPDGNQTSITLATSHRSQPRRPAGTSRRRPRPIPTDPSLPTISCKIHGCPQTFGARECDLRSHLFEAHGDIDLLDRGRFWVVCVWDGCAGRVKPKDIVAHIWGYHLGVHPVEEVL